MELDDTMIEDAGGENTDEMTENSPLRIPSVKIAIDRINEGKASATDAADQENRPRRRLISLQSPSKRSSAIPNYGPPGRVDIDGYDIAVLIASGWGIIAQVSYLLRGCRNTSDRLQRIHLIWRLEYLEEAHLAQDFLNQALFEDSLDD